MDLNGNKVKNILKQFEGLQQNSNENDTVSVLKPQPKARELSRSANNINQSGMLKYGNRNGFVEIGNSVINKDKDHPVDNDNPTTSNSPEDTNNRRNAIFIDSLGANNDEPISKDIYRASDNSSQRSSKSSISGGGIGGTGDNSSTGSAVYVRVKRSNAFRQKEVIDGPITVSTNNKSKMVLERVRSLDSNCSVSNNKEKKKDTTYETLNNIKQESDDDQQQQQQQQRMNALSAPSILMEQQYKVPAAIINVVTPYQVSEINKYSAGYNSTSQPPVAPFSSEYAIPYPQHHHQQQNHVLRNQIQIPLPPPRNMTNLQNNYQSLSKQQIGFSAPPYINPPPPPPTSTVADGYNLRKTNSYGSFPIRASNPIIPPEKPPRTFLYDILSDNSQKNQLQKQHRQNSTNDLVSKNDLTLSTSINPSSSSPLLETSTSNSSKNIRGGQINTMPNLFSKENFKEIISTENSNNVNFKNIKTSSLISQSHPLLQRSKTESQIVFNKSKQPSNNIRKTLEMEFGLPQQDIRQNYQHNHNHNHLHQYNNSGLPPLSGPAGISKNRQSSMVKVDEVDSKINSNYSNQQPTWIHMEPKIHTAQIVPASGKLIAGGGCVSNNAVSKSDDRLCEKSKSEWALNQSLSASGRRNTIANLATTGHLLDSSASNNSSKDKKGLQQSIQNFVNQLFSIRTTKEANSSTSTDSGIQLGSESLSSCDTPIGDSTTDTGDSDCENDGGNQARQMVEQRKTYVRRVSSIKVQELGPSLQRLLFQNSKKAGNSKDGLFECLLVVGLNRDSYRGTYHAYIRDKFPSNSKLAPGVEQFVFPDALEWPLHEGTTAQFYTLAITDHRGNRKFGCCFRILPEGSAICIPITYCLITSHRAIGFYREILREITLRHGVNEYQMRHLLEELYKKSFPSPSESISVQEINSSEEIYGGSMRGIYDGSAKNNNNNFLVPSLIPPPKPLIFKRRADKRLEENELVTLLSTMDINMVLKVFGSLLLERKVVLLSRALSTLSFCVESFETLLFPFSWQHTFVPILPLNMTDVIEAPAPFLIGVLKSSQTQWEKTLDEGMVVDLDLNKVLNCVGDEGTILPKRIHRKIRDALQLVMNLTEQKESTKNVLISECFIRMFVEALGHYSNYITVQQDGQKIFDRDSFIKSSESKATQNFLEWFSETSMFHEFIEIRLKNKLRDGLFEQRILEQLDSQNQSQQSNQMKNAKFFLNKGSTSNKPFGNWNLFRN